MTTFVLRDVLPQNGRGRYAHYENQRVGTAQWQFCDVRQLAFEAGDEWSNDVDRWHRSLSRRAAAITTFWWLLPGARLCAWAPVDVKALWFARALLACASSDADDELVVLGVPDEVAEYLDEWSGAKLATPISVKDERSTEAGKMSLKYLAPAIGAVRALARRAFLQMRPRRKRSTSKVPRRAGLLVWSQALSPGAVASLGDHFFGYALDCPEISDLGVCWLYDAGRFQNLEPVCVEAEKLGRTVIFDFECLKWCDVAWVAWEVFRIRRRLRSIVQDPPILTIGGVPCAAFSRRFVQRTIVEHVPEPELATYRAMKRCLTTVEPMAVLFPREEKGVERAILRACREHDTPVRTIGFAHAALSKGHFYMKDHADVGQPAPDLTATTGPSALEWLARWGGVPRTRMFVVGSPRSGESRAPNRSESRSGLRVVFLVGFGSEVEQLAAMAEQCPTLLDGCDLWIRRYPYAWHAAQDRGLRRLRAVGVTFRADEASLDTQFAWADVALFCSTSAGIQAMLAGRPAIRVSLDDILEADPTADKTHAASVWRCRSADELSASLQAFARSVPDSLAEREREFALALYAPFNVQLLRTVVAAYSVPAGGESLPDSRTRYSLPRAAGAPAPTLL